ncbi:MAG: hypothetical protein LQ351_002841 [Letrouitia transgressa]|nr:MAG: hypothetical protein LQ351_002841 [Letrouitia transgressa]
MSISQHRSVGHVGSEMQLPIHSGPPRRNNGSSLSSGYSGSRHHLNPANSMSAPERPPTSNRRSPNSHNLPSIYNITPGAPPYPPPHSQPALVAPGISQSDVNYPSSHLHMQHQAEFEAVDVGDKANKKRRGNLPKSTTEILKEWLVQHLDHAYPNEEQKQMLIERTGMSTSQVENPCLTKNTLFANSSFCDGVAEEEKQVSNWFINARRRNVPKMVAQAQAENNFRTNQDRSSQSVSPSTPESTDERARSR